MTYLLLFIILIIGIGAGYVLAKQRSNARQQKKEERKIKFWNFLKPKPKSLTTMPRNFWAYLMRRLPDILTN